MDPHVFALMVNKPSQAGSPEVLCCCLLPGTFLLCLAVESSSHYGDGCSDVAYGVWLAGEASGGCLLHLNEPEPMSGWALTDAANHCISYCSASFLSVPAHCDGRLVAAEATSLTTCCARWFHGLKPS